MSNPYIPRKAIIESIRDETPDIKTFRIKFKDGSFNFNPGQFVMVSMLGVGESAISISSHPEDADKFVELSIRKVGNVTGSIFKLKPGSTIGIRGPFGNGWPMDEASGKNLLIVGGGCGQGALRPLILDVLRHRDCYGRVEILYGARTPQDLMFKYEHDIWARVPDGCLLLTVDSIPTSVEWKYNLGVVTTLFGKTLIKPENSLALICGPEIMMHFAVRGLLSMGFKSDQIYLSMERRMKCGIGKCGHCQIGSKYVCKDGPVFTHSDLIHEPDKIL
ncbi:FAD/NAD(P)-binding protein [Candidatus Bathyarchaeota archaeon]|nr:FAD/NAD(P)-binding protein [Candidatus Bathyarchaeota archaeon]MBS7613048.1 FAD/NAD(P)-binding protein [Candidatus Bathyarchaeota archaeon]